MDDRPRERLRALGAEALSEAELVSLVLRTGNARSDALEVARALCRRCGGLAGISGATPRDLCSVSGVGVAKAASLLASLEIGRRVATRRVRVGDAIRCPADIHRHFYERLRDALQESFIVVLLDGRHRLRGEVTVSRGTLTASLVHPREVFRSAVRESAAAIVLVHNHPSGDPTPSLEDRRVTQRLREAGEIVGVRIVDHVIVAEGGYHSFSEAGDLED